MGCVGLLLALMTIPGTDKPRPDASAPVLGRTFSLGEVRGAVDRTGIPGRIDHMNVDPKTNRLFIAYIANGSVEVIDLESGTRVGTITGLLKPQGVWVGGGSVYVATGGEGKLHSFDTRTLAAGPSIPAGDDADNVRVGPDGKIWVSFGGEGPGGLASFDARTLERGRTIALPRMPEGFQLHSSGTGIFANLPAGKRSDKDGSVVGLNPTTGERLWGRPFSGRAGNFPMTLDSARDRVFVVTRKPARLLCLSARDGTILGEAPCPPESDDLFFDPRSNRVAVIGGGSPPKPGDPGGSGASIDLFAIDGSGRPTRVGGTPLPPHTRTGTLAVDRRNLYVGVPGTFDRPAEIREYRLPD